MLKAEIPFSVRNCQCISCRLAVREALAGGFGQALHEADRIVLEHPAADTNMMAFPDGALRKQVLGNKKQLCTPHVPADQVRGI